MRIGELAQRLGTTAHAIRFYERHGFVPPARRGQSGYHDYNEVDISRLRLLIGLRTLGLPLDHASELAGLCVEGKCEQVSNELRGAIAAKRGEIARRTEELRYLDHHLAHLAGELESGKSPRPLITLGKEGWHAS